MFTMMALLQHIAQSLQVCSASSAVASNKFEKRGQPAYRLYIGIQCEGLVGLQGGLRLLRPA